MIDFQKIVSSYTCPKCRGRSCHYNEVVMESVLKRLFFRSLRNRYLLVTCSLCGYTETYSLNVLAAKKKDIPAKESSPAMEKAD